MKLLLVFLLLGLAGCVREPVAGRIGEPAPVRTAVSAPPPDSRVVPAMEPEQVRTGCIEGRRLICGKVLKILPDGLVVDSGYTDFRTVFSHRHPQTRLSAFRRGATLGNKPGTTCRVLVAIMKLS
jgi:hypothetical protein